VRIVIQRVSRARVSVSGETRASIGRGLLLLVGVEREDDAADVEKTADKIAHLRIFALQPGVDDRMERSVLDISGELLVVSRFTLAGSLKKGRRPGFDGAAPPERAEPIYTALVAALRARGARVATGVFRAMMDVELVNEGPVTFVLETGK